MAMPAERIHVDSPVSVRVSSRSGSVTVAVGAEGMVEVSGGASIARDDDGSLVVKGPHGGSKSLELMVPRDTNLLVGTSSGRIRTAGRLGAVRASSESGAIEVESAASLDARTSSGQVRVGHCFGPCRIQTNAGQARVGRCDDRTEVATEAGRVVVGEARGDLRVRTAHGAVDLNAVEPVNVAVQTMSGQVRVALPSDTHPRTHFRSRSGKMSCDLAEGDDCQVAVQTLSGGLEVVSA